MVKQNKTNSLCKFLMGVLLPASVAIFCFSSVFAQPSAKQTIIAPYILLADISESGSDGHFAWYSKDDIPALSQQATISGLSSGLRIIDYQHFNIDIDTFAEERFAETETGTPVNQTVSHSING